MSINTEIARLEAAKTALAASITGKGVTVPDGTKLDGMPALVDSIQQGGREDWQITDANYLFYSGARWPQKDELLPHLGGITSAIQMFGSITFSSFDLSGFDFSKVQNASSMFAGVRVLKSASGIKLPACTCVDRIFQSCTGLTSVDTAGMFGKNVSAEGMFYGCSAIKSITLVGTFNKISNIFYNCYGLESVDLTGAVLSNVTDISALCYGCSKLRSIDMSGLNLSSVRGGSNIFRNCSALTEILGFAAPQASSLGNPFPIGTASSPAALERLTFQQISGGYAVRTSFSIAYSSFDRAGMVEMFSSLPDITPLNLTISYKKITITGNPCVTDGTLTDTDKAIATDKGWTLVI